MTPDQLGTSRDAGVRWRDEWRSRPISPGAYSSMYGLAAEIRAGWRHLVAPVVERRVGRWVTFRFADPADLQDIPACYVVQVDGVTVYVGQTSSLRTRFKGHNFRAVWPPDHDPVMVTPWGHVEISRVRFKRRISVLRYDWLMHEARLISRLSPLFNERTP